MECPASFPSNACKCFRRATKEAALIDDLEDGDSLAGILPERIGVWYEYDDETGGDTWPPLSALPVPSPVYPPRGNSHSAFHFIGHNHTYWGGGVGVALISAAASECYDAGAFAGFSFSAKGPGTIRAQIGTAATKPAELGGWCEQKVDLCNDDYGVDLKLSSDWQEFTVRWADLRQQGWGKKVSLDISAMITLSFQTMGASTGDWDYWIDDVRLIGWNDAACTSSAPECSPLVASSSSDAGGGGSLDPTVVPSGCNDPTYPPGPYGTHVGDVIANLGWLGKTDANHNGTVADEGVSSLCLGRHRDPGRTRAIVINRIAGWCTPCRQQTKATLMPLFAASGGDVAIVQGLLEGASPGQLPFLKDLDTWQAANGAPFDLVIDSKQILQLIPPADDAGSNVYPQNIVVRSDTMQITYESSGPDASGLTSAIAAILVSGGDAGSDSGQ